MHEFGDNVQDSCKVPPFEQNLLSNASQNGLPLYQLWQLQV